MGEKENKMVTLSFLLVFILLNSLTILIDIVLFHYSFSKELGNLYYINPLFGRISLYCMMIIGLASSIIIDIRIKKNKRQKQTT